jgi:glutathione synthase/RimK-type ligase-like ATP-grasp enzyme
VILTLTNSTDRTVDYLWERLGTARSEWYRLNTDLVVDRVMVVYEAGQSYFSVDGNTIRPEKVIGLWYRRPRPIAIDEIVDSARARHVQAEWAEALEGMLAQIPFKRWINHPTANANSSHKIEQLMRARQLGLFVPDTMVTQSDSALRRFWTAHAGRVICKPLASGYLESDRPLVIYTSLVAEDHVAAASLLARCPTMFQELIDKELDVRVCVVDETVLAVGLRCLDHKRKQRLDIRRDNMRGVVHGQIDLPCDIQFKVRTLVKSYGLRYGAIDMAIDRAGRWIFFELNPNGQWAWLDQVGAADIAGALISALSAREV